MNLTMRLCIPHEQVEELIKQDPMGTLDKPVEITINGRKINCMVDGYVHSLGYPAVLTFSGNEETE